MVRKPWGGGGGGGTLLESEGLICMNITICFAGATPLSVFCSQAVHKHNFSKLPLKFLYNQTSKSN